MSLIPVWRTGRRGRSEQNESSLAERDRFLSFIHSEILSGPSSGAAWTTKTDHKKDVVGADVGLG